MNKMNVGYFWVSEMGLMLRLKSFMGNGLFVVSWKTFMSCGSVKGGEEISGIKWVWVKGDGWWAKRRALLLVKMTNEFQSFRGVAQLVFWLVCLCFYNEVFREAFINKDLKNIWPLRGDESESSFPGIFY